MFSPHSPARGARAGDPKAPSVSLHVHRLHGLREGCCGLLNDLLVALGDSLGIVARGGLHLVVAVGSIRCPGERGVKPVPERRDHLFSPGRFIFNLRMGPRNAPINTAVVQRLPLVMGKLVGKPELLADEHNILTIMVYDPAFVNSHTGRRGKAKTQTQRHFCNASHAVLLLMRLRTPRTWAVNPVSVCSRHRPQFQPPSPARPYRWLHFHASRKSCCRRIPSARRRRPRLLPSGTLSLAGICY